MMMRVTNNKKNNKTNCKSLTKGTFDISVSVSVLIIIKNDTACCHEVDLLYRTTSG